MMPFPSQTSALLPFLLANQQQQQQPNSLPNFAPQIPQPPGYNGAGGTGRGMMPMQGPQPPSGSKQPAIGSNMLSMAQNPQQMAMLKQMVTSLGFNPYGGGAGAGGLGSASDFGITSSGTYDPAAISSAFGDVTGGGSTAGGAAGGAAAGGQSGAAGLGGMASPLAIAAAIGIGKNVESNDPNSPMGKGLLAMLGPSASQVMKDPVGMGLPTLFGLPFITPWTSSAKSQAAKPEWQSLFGLGSNW